MSATTVQFFFTMRDQLKLHHWQTESFARHKATDKIISSLEESIDTFVEVYMGKYGRPRVGRATGTVQVRNLTEKTVITFVKGCIGYLMGPLTKDLTPKDTDLVNIRDEMLADLHQLLYLFSLK
jgi:hypothetical protein